MRLKDLNREEIEVLLDDILMRWPKAFPELTPWARRKLRKMASMAKRVARKDPEIQKPDDPKNPR